MKTAFIFDFDGTIGETIPLVLSAIESAYADMGLTAPSREVIQSNFGPNERGLCQRLFPDSKEKAETLYQRYLFHYEAQHDKFSPRPFTGIRVALKTLSENRIPIGIVTGKGDDSAKISLLKYDIVDLFSVIECGSERGAIKPEKIKAVLALTLLFLVLGCSSAIAAEWTIEVNNKSVDAEVKIIEGRSLIPLRAVGEALGLDVAWDGEKQAVYLVCTLNNIDNVVVLYVPTATADIGIQGDSESTENNVNKYLYHEKGFELENISGI